MISILFVQLAESENQCHMAINHATKDFNLALVSLIHTIFLSRLYTRTSLIWAPWDCLYLRKHISQAEYHFEFLEQLPSKINL